MLYLRSIFLRIIAVAAICAGFGLLGTRLACAQTQTGAAEFPMRIQGDIGVGGYYTRSIIRGNAAPAHVLPYGYFDYGRIFARIDTFGVKTVRMGFGYLELAGRVALDGYKADAGIRGLTERKNSVPLGIGTFQETPIGGFFVNAFHDINKSQGNLYEAIYAGEIVLPGVTLYPQIGAEYLSQKYTGYYYGVSGAEASAGDYGAYRPGGAFNPFVAVLADTKLTEDVHLIYYLRHKWLASAIQDSPIVGRRALDTAFVALTYRFN